MFLPLWAGYLIVTVVLFVVAGILAMLGKGRISKVKGKPERTIATSKETVEAVSYTHLSTSEIESALVSHPAVAEAAVVGATDEMTGQTPVAFVILRGGTEVTDGLTEELLSLIHI